MLLRSFIDPLVEREVSLSLIVPEVLLPVVAELLGRSIEPEFVVLVEPALFSSVLPDWEAVPGDVPVAFWPVGGAELCAKLAPANASIDAAAAAVRV